jgi:hypothetical protein
MSENRKRPSRKEYAAIGVLVLNPDWTNEQIAKEVGIHRGSLARMVEFVNLRARVKASGLQTIPRGTKIVNQHDPSQPAGLEAWSED